MQRVGYSTRSCEKHLLGGNQQDQSVRKSVLNDMLGTMFARLGTT